MSENTGADAPIVDTIDTPTDETQNVEAEVIEPTPEEEEEFELQVDGNTEKVKKSELLKRASHASAAAKRMQEATKVKNDATRFMDLLKSDPIRVLKEIKQDFNEKDFISKRFNELLEEDLMTEDERKTKYELKELAEYRRQAEEAKNSKQQEELNQLAETTQQQLDVEISDAMKVAGLPRTNAAVKRLATYMLEANQNGLNIPTAKLAAQVKQDIQVEVLELLKVSDDDAFQAILGSDLLTKAQKISLKKVKRPGDPVPPSLPLKEANRPVDKRTLSKDDFLKEAGLF